ncbi:MAG: hypothetical protein V3U55_04635 [Mycobacterium sp.]
MPNELIVVSLTVAPEDEAEFTDFYHHCYIPKLLSLFPEIASARSYVEHNLDLYGVEVISEATAKR